MNIDITRYYDMDGLFLWEDKLGFKRLWAVGDPIIEEGKSYSVSRVAVAAESLTSSRTIQIVNVIDEPIGIVMHLHHDEEPAVILAPYVHIPDELQATLKPETLLEIHELLDEALGLLGPKHHIHVTAELDDESRLNYLLNKAIHGLAQLEHEEIVEMLELLKTTGKNETDPRRIICNLLYGRVLMHELDRRIPGGI